MLEHYGLFGEEVKVMLLADGVPGCLEFLGRKEIYKAGVRGGSECLE